MAADTGDGTTITLGSFNAIVTGEEGVDHNDSAQVLIVTPLSDTSGYPTKIAGPKDGGQWTIGIFYDPAATIPGVGTEEELVVTWPDGSTSTCDVIVTGRQRGARWGNVMKGQLTLDVSGAIVEA